VEQALALPGLPREKVLATVVRLLETTMIRIGNAEYARANKSFGLTTLRNRHVEVAGRAVAFRFRGKSGVMHDIRLQDPRVARIIRRMRDLPGQELFQYLDDDGQTHCIDSSDVNDYLREISGEDYTAKDFRTWAGTMLAARELRALEACASETEGKKLIVQAIAAVAQRLGNTPAVCRKCYVHPAVLDSYLRGALHAAAADPSRDEAANDPHALDEEELAVLALLETQAGAAA
jgi:DNA topoisomerase-1